ncbi:MAG: hypothetical protein NTU97_04340 [Candidatus Magasanikbacteria bacterium]|nr:hypothetical protein [Candidatus Magasanikbacteria bacterium]
MCSAGSFQKGGVTLDSVRAIVQTVIQDGRHGPFVVATTDQLQGSVTFSLESTVWKEEDWPEKGMVVYLEKLRQKRAGWRAKMGRFWKPSDEQPQQGAKSMDLSLIEGVVSIGGDLYVKSPEALEKLFAELRSVGYKIEDLRQADYRKKDGVAVETMEKEGWSLWFASLNVTRAKCGSCHGLISPVGVQHHGHKCELCDEVTYYEIIDGSEVRFSFISSHEGENYDLADITMKAHHWDSAAGYLYLYPEIYKGLFSSVERAKRHFEANKDKWKISEGEGRDLIKIRYSDPWNHETAVISMSDIRGNYWNHQIVQIWEGREYPEFTSDFPVPTSMSIYETWHWPLLESSPILHKRVLSAIHHNDDKGWHYQDGRPYFTRKMFAEMGKFVRHFTKLDADAWDEQISQFRLDGPGGIDDVAAFCHPRAQVENRPNVGNILVGMGKVLSGQKLADGELAALADALKDPTEAGKFAEAFPLNRGRKS